jgi:lysophospholipase L1-like esterase
MLALPGCAASRSAPAGATGVAPATARSTTLQLVGLGDSISTANQCSGCTDLVSAYAQRAAKTLGRPVDAQNLSMPNADIQTLLKQTAAEQPQEALSHADIVVVTIGFNDTPWNRIDNPCDAAPQYPVIQWRKITSACVAKVTAEYGRDLDALLTRVEKLRKGAPTVLRVVSVYDSVIGDHADPGWDAPEAVQPSIAGNLAFMKEQCAVARRHHGQCVDLLHAINGPTVSQDAAPYLSEHTHMNQRGHDLAAQLLDGLGYTPSTP